MAMNKDRIAGSAKEIKGSIKETIGKAKAMPSWRLTARPTRSKARSKTLSVVSRTR